MMMLSLYRCLLSLYPSSHRREYGEEMTAVFREAQAETENKAAVARCLFWFREIGGLVRGAIEEHARSMAGSRSWVLLPTRRFTMHSEFRFPKPTALLMTVILAAIVMAIEKAQAISASLPHVNPPVGPIQPEHFTFLPSVALMFAGAYLAGLIGWAILFALKRSGVHRLSGMQDSGQE
jgi:hypothetical protein